MSYRLNVSGIVEIVRKWYGLNISIETYFFHIQLYFEFFMVCWFWFLSHTPWFLGYSLLCAQRLSGTRVGNDHALLGIEPRSSSCEACAQPVEFSLSGPWLSFNL